jgi:phosphohistidine swiveling domain-containing protein
MIRKFNPPLVINPNKDLFRWKVDAYPAFIYAVCCDMTKSPYGWPQSEGFFIGHDFYWYDNWSDIWSHGDKYIAKYLKNSHGALPAGRYRKYNTAFKILRRQVAAVARLNFRGLSLSELRRAWFGFLKVYSHFWFVVTDIEVLSYAASHRLEQLITRGKIPLNPEEISQLSAFPQRSYILEEEYELLKIAFFLKTAGRAVALRRHARKFSWILNGYHGVRRADENFFRKRLQKLLRDKKSLEHYYHLKHYYRETNKRFSAVVKKYKLDREIVKYARLAQQASFIQDRRKALSWLATDYIVELYRVLAKFLGISLEQSLYILWDEFDRALGDKKKLLIEIAKRQRSCRLRIMGDRTTISTADVGQIFSVFEKEYTKASNREIKGTVAYAGQVTGRVQIVANGRQINSFKPGRILVALMTSPDYILAMKRAKAIVTDDGGLTCHAAIVARELKKPCIVGTRNATRLLHDGDLVEVDANQGKVKIIKGK